jgi:hypothetical protein
MSIYIIPQGSIALVYSKGDFSKSRVDSGIFFIIPFKQDVVVFTDKYSGSVIAYKPNYTVDYSYIINEQHYKDFHTRSMHDHENMKFWLSASLNKHLTKEHTINDVQTIAEKIFSNHTINNSKYAPKAPLFAEVSIKVVERKY